jgi:hypothetical protein
LALLFENLGLLFEFVHMQTYAVNGQGFFFMNLLNNIFSILAQFVITIVFLLISMGWTITFKDIEEKNDLFLPL